MIPPSKGGVETGLILNSAKLQRYRTRTHLAAGPAYVPDKHTQDNPSWAAFPTL